MENEEHLNLLPKMDFFVTNEPRFIACMTAYPDKNEKGHPGVIVKYFLPGINLIR